MALWPFLTLQNIHRGGRFDLSKLYKKHKNQINVENVQSNYNFYFCLCFFVAKSYNQLIKNVLSYLIFSLPRTAFYSEYRKALKIIEFNLIFT